MSSDPQIAALQKRLVVRRQRLKDLQKRRDAAIERRDAARRDITFIHEGFIADCTDKIEAAKRLQRDHPDVATAAEFADVLARYEQFRRDMVDRLFAEYEPPDDPAR